LRIGFDARTIQSSGIGTYSRNLLLEFARSDIEFVIFCHDQKKELVPEADNFELVSANISALSRSGPELFSALARSTRLDLLHVPSHLAPTPVPVPLVTTIHDVIPLIYPRSIRNPLSRMIYRRQLDRTLTAASCVITVSRISQSALHAYAGVEPGRVRVIHNGVADRFSPVEDEEELHAVRHRYQLPERFALWIGQFRPQKNLEFLVQGWGRVQSRLTQPPDLVLAGTQEGEFHKIRREVVRRGLEAQVHFPGFIRESDLPALYSAAEVFIFPSLYEGFGLPPLEAMASGTPTVVSNSSALPEVTGRAAMLFNPTSTEQLVDCIVRVLEDHDLRERLRREGFRQSALFRWAKAAAETRAVYETVLGG
jgi:glycosyltransferase involved in cell wall biosynthesis